MIDIEKLQRVARSCKNGDDCKVVTGRWLNEILAEIAAARGITPHLDHRPATAGGVDVVA